MRKFVRESKFRHVYGQPSPKDQIFDGVNVSSSRLDGTILAVNRCYIAAVLSSSGGGVFTVLNRSKPGRYERVFRCISHTSEIIDLCFDPFNTDRIISGADDGSFIVWWIPDGGLESDLSEFVCMVRGSQKRAVMSVWHPTAADIVFCVNVDSVHIFNVATGESVRSIDTSLHTEQIYNISLNMDGTAFACVCKDKKVRIFCTLTGELKQEFQAHEGSKPGRLSWLYKVGNGQFVLTTGATKMSERQVCVWNLKSTEEPVFSDNLDNASAVLNIQYDPDTSLVALFSKGEASVRIFELESNGQMFLVSLYQAQEPQRAGAFGNKLSCNVMSNEILHMVRALNKGIDEVAFIVPRRSDQFQEDLFPDTFSDTPAMTAEDFVAGKVTQPNLISLKSITLADSSSGSNSKLQITSSTGFTRLASMNSSIKRVSVGGGFNGATSELQNEINELKATLKDHAARIEALEKNLNN